MGTEAIVVGAIMGALTAVTSYVSSEAQSSAQAAQNEYQAAVADRNAELAVAEGQIEQTNLQREKVAIQEAFDYEQGQNISMLASGNVDITSGSAAAALEGNIQSYADDIAWNQYQKDLAQWETDEEVKGYEYESSYYQSAANSLSGSGLSLLTAGLTGASTGLGAYGALK